MAKSYLRFIERVLHFAKWTSQHDWNMENSMETFEYKTARLYIIRSRICEKKYLLIRYFYVFENPIFSNVFLKLSLNRMVRQIRNVWDIVKRMTWFRVVWYLKNCFRHFITSWNANSFCYLTYKLFSPFNTHKEILRWHKRIKNFRWAVASESSSILKNLTDKNLLYWWT